MNKQIEEMAKDVASTQIGTVKPDLTLTELGEVYKGEFILRIAKHLYNAGYRKQSEGEWVYNTDDFTPKQRCTVCGYNKPIAAGEGIIQEPKHFCPNCGAKMKGV